MRQRQLVLLYILFFFLAASTVALIVFEKPIQSIIRASGTVPSGTKSVILADKILAKPTDIITITVFVRNENGDPLGGKSVQVITTGGLLSPPSSSSDTSGKSAFTLKSSGNNQVTVKASVEGVDVANSITVYFTQQ